MSVNSHQTVSETTRIQGLDFLILPTQDLGRAEHFYRDVLGLAVDSHERDVWMEFELGDGLILTLVDWSKLGKPFAPVTAGVVSLRVADVEATVERLRALGVVFDAEIIDTGVCKMAYFFDPDGNRLLLHHRYAPVASAGE